MSKTLGNVIRIRMMDEEYTETGPMTVIMAIHSMEKCGYAAETLIINSFVNS